MPLIVFLIVFASMVLTKIVTTVPMLPFHLIEKKIQWGNKSLDYWKQQGVEAPGERIKSVSFLFGVLHTTVGMFCAVLSAAFVFQFFKSQISVTFLAIASILFISHDLMRIQRFLGNSGIWTELGYLVGDIAGLTAGIMFVKLVL